MGRRRTRAPGLIRMLVGLTQEQIDYVYRNHESLSAGVRQIVADTMDREHIGIEFDETKLEFIYNSHKDIVTEVFHYTHRDGDDLTRFSPSFAGFCEKKWGIRPSEGQVTQFLKSKFDLMYPPEYDE